MASTVQYTISLIPWADPVMYQGNEGACGGVMINNGLGLMSNLYGQHFEANAQIVYNMTLIQQHTLGTDTGVVPEVMWNVLTTQGATERTDIDYGIQSINVTPSQADYTDAATHTITGLAKLPVDSVQENRLSHQIAQFLLQGKPLFMAFQVTANLEAESGPLSQQSGNDFGPSIGGHFAEIAAVDTAHNTVSIATWGTQYGDQGYFKVSLDSFYMGTGGNPLNLQDIYVVQGFDHHNLIQNTQTEAVAAGFVGMFDRAPALPGMNNYVNLLNSGLTTDQIYDNMLSTSEGRGLYGSATNEQFVTSIFQNTLDRSPLAGGLAFYTNQLTNGATRGHVAAEIIIAGLDKAEWQDGLFFGDGSVYPSVHNVDPNIYTESLLFQNKVIAAQDFAITLQAGSGHTDVAHTLIDNVTTDPGSIWGVALVGVPEQLGHPHITGAIIS